MTVCTCYRLKADGTHEASCAISRTSFNRPVFHDAAQVGRSRPTRLVRDDQRLTYSDGYEDGRTAEVAASAGKRALQWRQLEAALFSLTNAQFEYERDADEAGRLHVEDCRRAIGALALSLSDGPDAEGYARLFDEISKAPTWLRPDSGMPQPPTAQPGGE